MHGSRDISEDKMKNDTETYMKGEFVEVHRFFVEKSFQRIR